VVPFHDSASVSVVPPETWEPTAMQLVALAQDTPVKVLFVLLGLAVAETVQVVPFHCRPGRCPRPCSWTRRCRTRPRTGGGDPGHADHRPIAGWPPEAPGGADIWQIVLYLAFAQE
jgi:hypothetical protein